MGQWVRRLRRSASGRSRGRGSSRTGCRTGAVLPIDPRTDAERPAVAGLAHDVDDASIVDGVAREGSCKRPGVRRGHESGCARQGPTSASGRPMRVKCV